MRSTGSFRHAQTAFAGRMAKKNQKKRKKAGLHAVLLLAARFLCPTFRLPT
jgi:hypothetical protein